MPRRIVLLFAGTVAGVLAALSIAFAMPAAQTSADQSIDTEEAAFVVLINNYRAAQNPPLGALTIDWQIQPAADWMSGDMGQYAYFSHTDRLGRDPWTRMCEIGGYCYNTWKGENIAAGYTTAQSVFTAWQNSPGHNANMLGANYTTMGLARVYTAGSPYGWYWTNDFGGYRSNATPPAGPTFTPTPTPTPTPTATPTRTPSPTPSPTRTPSPTPTRSPSPTPVPLTPTPTPAPTASPTRSPSPTPLPPTPTPTPTPIPTATPTATPQPTATPTPRIIGGLPKGATPRATRTPVHRQSAFGQ